MSATDDRDNVDALSTGESLFDLLRKRDRNVEINTHVSAPGTIDSYDATTQRADVTLGFLRVEDAADAAGRLNPDPPIKIPGVRVVFPRTATAYDTMPIAKGDTGLLIFADRALDRWHAKGGAGPVDPVDARAHSLADAVFLPGLAHDGNVISPAPSATARVVHGPEVHLREGAAEALVWGTSLAADAATIQATLAATPAATDPATTQALANANNAALISLLSSLQSQLSTTVKTR